MTCYHVHGDEAGETHLRVVDLPLVENTPAGTLRTIHGIPVTTAGITEFVNGKKDPGVHAPPEREIFVVLGGELEIEPTRGAAARLRPGDVLFLDDVDTLGHSSRDVGEETLALMVVWIGEDWELPRI
jgi:uncharacterized cupin superfamily protein